MTQKHSSEFLLTVSGIQYRVPRRTLSTHTARAFTNAPRGTRSLPPPIPHCELADDSWDGATPDCPLCRFHHAYASVSDGHATPFPASTVDRRPDISRF